ncbi:embryonic stem cell-related gene protein-like [Symphalangus syndactylus]|uniref:embryonic stem cell-related gene protein-like n=1 Tax=Symphalangus syndactylus TaxID=9590 RepID=UPI00300760ED
MLKEFLSTFDHNWLTALPENFPPDGLLKDRRQSTPFAERSLCESLSFLFCEMETIIVLIWLTLFSDSARLHPGEINSHVAHTKPVWWSLHMDACGIWCRDLDRGTSLGRSIPCPPALCSLRKIHLRPQVLRPTSPRNISPISNLDSTGNRTVQLTWQPLPEPLELWPKAL